MATFNLDDKAKTIDNKDLHIGSEVPTYRDLLLAVLNARSEKESFEETTATLSLARKITKASEEVELSAEEIVKLKKLAHLQTNPIFFCVCAYLEP